jgi:hypothetical protein
MDSVSAFESHSSEEIVDNSQFSLVVSQTMGQTCLAYGLSAGSTTSVAPVFPFITQLIVSSFRSIHRVAIS